MGAMRKAQGEVLVALVPGPERLSLSLSRAAAAAAAALVAGRRPSIASVSSGTHCKTHKCWGLGNVKTDQLVTRH
jgi:hypothetical protein